MRIGYIVPSLVQAGPINVVLDLVKLMTSHGHECVVYYFDKTVALPFPCETRRIISYVTHIPFNCFDVIHTHGLRPNLYVLFHKPLLSKKLFISTFHNYVFEDFRLKYGKKKAFWGGNIFLLSAIRHNRIITLSRDAMRYYGRWFKQSKLDYIYNSRVMNPDATLSRIESDEILNFKSESTLIGINCSIHSRKGIDLLIQAMPLLPSKFRLFIAGDGTERSSYESLAQKLNVADKVYFAGMRKEAYRYLPFYDIYALPSRSEGFPLSLLEAAAWGKKIVCSDIPVFKEAFTKDEVAMFKLPNVADLAEAIIRIDKEDAFGNNVKRKFDAEYSPECMYNKHMAIYQQKD